MDNLFRQLHLGSEIALLPNPDKVTASGSPALPDRSTSVRAAHCDRWKSPPPWRPS